MKKRYPFLFLLLIYLSIFLFSERVRELGIRVGILKTGKYNSITDVKGVLVGHKTIIKGDDVRTGITVIIPHSGNIFRNKVPAAVYVGNGFGKLVGYTQIEELGQIETPIALTNTLNVWRVADALIDYTLSFKENSSLRSINPVVGETNDGFLNNIQKRAVKKEDVFYAIEHAKSGLIKEGSVGAGTGTVCFGFKGGIGTSSRVLPEKEGGYTVGVLVQTNFGGILRVGGYPVGKELGGNYYLERLSYSPKGSCMIIVATDAPLSSRNLLRLAKRAMLGLARTGGISSNGSGDYVIAFSTAYTIDEEKKYSSLKLLNNSSTTPLFLAVEEATEEAILNSLFQAEKVCGYRGCVDALPKKRVLEILKGKGILK